MGDSAEAGMVCRVETDTGGTWRKGEFVRWTDLFAFVEGMLVWLGLLVLSMALLIGALAARNPGKTNFTSQLTALSQNGALHYAISISLYAVLLFFFWRIAKRVSDSALAARFRSLPLPTFLIAVFTGMALAVAVPMVIALLMQHNLVELKPTQNEQHMVPHAVGDWLVALFAIAVMAPLTEELYFRGILLGWLKRKMPVVLAVLLNAAIFGLVHFSFVQHPGTGGLLITGILMLVGLIAATFAVRTGSLWASFGVHSGYNAVLVTLPMIQVLLR